MSYDLRPVTYIATYRQCGVSGPVLGGDEEIIGESA